MRLFAPPGRQAPPRNFFDLAAAIHDTPDVSFDERDVER
jgi:hypothetical protein